MAGALGKARQKVASPLAETPWTVTGLPGLGLFRSQEQCRSAQPWNFLRVRCRALLVTAGPFEYRGAAAGLTEPLIWTVILSFYERFDVTRCSGRYSQRPLATTGLTTLSGSFRSG